MLENFKELINPEDILLDIYFYKKEYEQATTKEEREIAKEKINNAEKLFVNSQA